MTNSTDIVGRMRALIITPIDEDIEFIKEADDAMEKAADLIQSQQALIEEMREALTFYADVSKYPAPLTGGMGDLWEDCGSVARKALSQKE